MIPLHPSKVFSILRLSIPPCQHIYRPGLAVHDHAKPDTRACKDAASAKETEHRLRRLQVCYPIWPPVMLSSDTALGQGKLNVTDSRARTR